MEEMVSHFKILRIYTKVVQKLHILRSHIGYRTVKSREPLMRREDLLLLLLWGESKSPEKY